MRAVRPEGAAGAERTGDQLVRVAPIAGPQQRLRGADGECDPVAPLEPELAGHGQPFQRVARSLVQPPGRDEDVREHDVRVREVAGTAALLCSPTSLQKQAYALLRMTEVAEVHPEHAHGAKRRPIVADGLCDRERFLADGARVGMAVRPDQGVPEGGEDSGTLRRRRLSRDQLGRLPERGGGAIDVRDVEQVRAEALVQQAHAHRRGVAADAARLLGGRASPRGARLP